MAGKIDKKKISDTLKSRRGVKWFWIIISVPFAMLIFMLLLTGLGVFGRLPTFEDLENPKSDLATEIYSEDGKIIGNFYIKNRSYVDYSELNDSLVAALVSTEDKRYYSHSGIDFISLARVGLKTVGMGRRQQGGGSTLTQQLAKNLFPRDTVRNRSTLSRSSRLVISKLKEWITAVKLEHNYTKEEIIAMYLNTVEFGSNAFGIKSAARIFFNKAPAELTINEAAMLVGVVNAPTKYSPRRSNPQPALDRRNTVLSRMKDSGFITRAQRDSLSKLPIVLDYTPSSHDEGQGTYFREMLRLVMTAPKPQRSHFSNEWDFEQEAKRWEANPIYGWCEKNRKPDGTPYNIYRDGLKIYTTINASMQQYAEDALWERMANSIQPDMNGQIKRTGRIFQDIPKDEIETIVRNAMRYSERYRNLVDDDATAEQIEKEFNTPVEMRVFSYKGDIDTLMTPRDSILYHKGIMRASFMAMDPVNGHVRAYVGGPDFRYFKYDMVKQGKRQVGSTIKPFIYTFAIDYLKFTPCTLVQNVPVTIETETGVPWQPKEAASNKSYEEVYTGAMRPLKWGLANSRNNYSAWIMKQSKSPEAVADLIHHMGISSYIDPVYALCLGTPDVSLFEMTGAYSTFANRGMHTEPIFVTRIEDRHGNLISTFTAESTSVINEQVAYTMLDMLKGVVNAGTAGRLNWAYDMKGVEVGGKTGTSQENRDAWFMAVLPKLVAGTWVGGEDQSVHFRSGGEGAARALPIFGEFIKKVYADPRLGISRTDKFPTPVGAVTYDCAPEQGQSEETAADSTFDEFFE